MNLCRASGWYPWIPSDSTDIFQSPYGYRQVEIAKEEWNGSQLTDPRTLDPATNVVDLWWRPVPTHVLVTQHHCPHCGMPLTAKETPC